MSQTASPKRVLPLLIPAPAPPEQLVKSFDERQDSWYRRRGAGVQVHCGGCHRRTFDVYHQLHGRGLAFSAHESDITGLAVVERMCPNCHALVSSLVTLNPGEPFEGGVDGPWLCTNCGVSLARIERTTGKIKASCWRKGCRQTVSVVALAALTGRYRSLDAERANRFAAIANDR